MKRYIATIALCLLTCYAKAAENWFLPYEPDDNTIALFHLDGEEDEQRSAAKPEISVVFHKGAEHAVGNFGKGAKLNGRGAILRMTRSEIFHLKNDQEFTVELWCRPETNADAGLISIATRFYLHIFPGRKTATFGYRAASFPIRNFGMANIPIRRGRWNHVALTHDKDRVARLYVNGRLVGTTSHKDEGDYAKAGSGVFGAHDGWTKFFTGSIDEIRISNCVRGFRPFVTQDNYLPGEQVQLALDISRLPGAIQSADVRIRSGKKVVFQEKIRRAELADPMVEACAVPEKNGSIEVRFLDAEGRAIAAVAETVSFAGKRLAECKNRLAALQEIIRGTEASVDVATRRQGLSLFIKRITELTRERNFDAAEGHLSAAERLGRSLRTGETAYRTKIRKLVRSTKSDQDIRISMSWPAEKDHAEDAFPWAKRVGANELVGSAHRSDPQAFDMWRAEGYYAAALCGIPIHDASWLKDHPEQRQYGFWRMDPVEAKKAKLVVKIESPTWGGHTVIDDFHDPKEHWKVIDTGDRNARPQWSYDKESHEVTITNAVSGHKYIVYFMFTNTGVGDPLYRPFEKRALENLDELLKPLAGHLQVYWFDDLGFAYPGPTPQKAWDWESYTLAARPENQKLFAKETGIEFDPEWLVMPPKTIEMVPDRPYLAWMKWVRARVEKWMVEATNVVRKHGMKSWLYWGDCHVGIEPFLGSITAGKVEQIDKPTSDPVAARALIDFPGEGVYRRLRVQWLSDYLVPLARCGDDLDTCWRRAKRGLLMNFPSAIYWMQFPNVAVVRDPAVREDVVETIAEISDEFTLLGRYLNGHKAFSHDINLYVINSWGDVYSWRPWGAARLVPLTDLPINVRFISFDEVAQDGVPKDAHVLFCYGQPNSSWSGGHFWKSPELKSAIEKFVRDGGGFIGMESPSHYDEPEPHWVLADLLGVAGEGTPEFKPDMFDQSMLADSGLQAPEEERPSARLGKTKAGNEHWITKDLAAHLLNMSSVTRVAKTAANAAILYTVLDAKGDISPGMVVREVGSGRAVYLAAWSSGYDFYRLLRRTIFWAARAEALSQHLNITGADDLFAYAYPTGDMIALLNTAEQKANTILRCAPNVFKLTANSTVQLRDIVTKETVFVGKGSQLGRGIELELIPNCVVLLKVVRE